MKMTTAHRPRPQAVQDVGGGFASGQRPQPVADGHLLIEGAKIGRAEAVGQAQLSDEDHLQRRVEG